MSSFFSVIIHHLDVSQFEIVTEVALVPFLLVILLQVLSRRPMANSWVYFSFATRKQGSLTHSNCGRAAGFSIRGRSPHYHHIPSNRRFYQLSWSYWWPHLVIHVVWPLKRFLLQAGHRCPWRDNLVNFACPTRRIRCSVWYFYVNTFLGRQCGPSLLRQRQVCCCWEDCSYPLWDNCSDGTFNPHRWRSFADRYTARSWSDQCLWCDSCYDHCFARRAHPQWHCSFQEPVSQENSSDIFYDDVEDIGITRQKISVRNIGEAAKTYTLSHVPAGTAVTVTPVSFAGE